MDTSTFTPQSEEKTRKHRTVTMDTSTFTPQSEEKTRKHRTVTMDTSTFTPQSEEKTRKHRTVTLDLLQNYMLQCNYIIYPTNTYIIYPRCILVSKEELE